jgi:beta-alanine degradation protein BauB
VDTETNTSAATDLPAGGATLTREDGQVATRVIYEDDHIRVWLLELAAGQASGWHQHRFDHAFLVTRPGRVRAEFADGQHEDQQDRLGDAVYCRVDGPHQLVNLGTSTYQNIVVEFLDRPGACT